MLNRGIRFIIENKLVAFFLILLVFILGGITSPFDLGLKLFPKNKVAVDAIPNIGDNQQIVFTKWDGRSPQDIEDQITYPLTSHLLGIPGVRSVRSTSMFGFSSIYLILEDDIDYYWSRSRILEKLAALPDNLLPKDVQPRLGPDATALGQVFWYTLEGRNRKGEVTGGWDLQELRSIQDFYVKNSLASSHGVSEVASIGGFVKEYQIDVKPELLKQFGISLNQVVKAVQNSNRDIGAQTIEINRAEYFVRGLGYVKNIKDIEGTSVVTNDLTTIHIRDIANVSFGPAERRGILDKGGAEVVGGVVTARFDANPMEVLQQLKLQIDKISKGLPKKKLADGSVSQLTIIPFYDRSELIGATLNTLKEALTLEILIAILVVVFMLRNLKVSFIISGLLPLAILIVFIAMKVFAIDANIVALSGIVIAVGTMVDMGIILTENIIRHLETKPNERIEVTVYHATKEVSGAIVTAGLTTIISFIPVFSLIGAEGKLFAPLAFTKTFALIAAMFITLFVIPPVAALVLRKNKTIKNKIIIPAVLIVTGTFALLNAVYTGSILIIYGLLGFFFLYNKINKKLYDRLNLVVTIIAVLFILSSYWRPLGVANNLFVNGVFVGFLTALVLFPIYQFIKYYELILRWVLKNKLVSISVPVVLVLLGFMAFLDIEKEFMPTLNEGEFLLMPTSLPHSGVEENNQVLKKLDIAVSAIPEIDYVVGKAGRAESPLDPAPLSMYENLISYKSEYIVDNRGKPIRFEVDNKGNFKTKSGVFVENGSGINRNELYEDTAGAYYRNWRAHIKNENDIWKEITKVTKLPGVTSAPKLQPIATRLVMLQTGMRSSLGIKIKGQDLKDIELFGLRIEAALKKVDGILPESVFADRISGKPYLLLDVDRAKIARYGLSIEDVQQTLEVGVGGKILTKTVEGRESYNVRVRYPRELRSSPEDLKAINVTLPAGSVIPLSELVTIRYERGPQSIKSEDGFLVGYVIFDKKAAISEVSVVQNAQRALDKIIKKGDLEVPNGINFEFSGTYKDHIRAQKTLSFIIPIVLITIFLILYLQFKSVSVAFMVFSGVAVAFAGGFILLWFYGQPWFINLSILGTNFRILFNIDTINLSVAIWVGFIALFGIATDDGVIMGTYLVQSFKNKPVSSISAVHESVVQAGKKRIRPCLMTSATTILALVPILTANGKGSSIVVPMAIPCLGGMLIALITLFVVPLLFCWQKELTLKRL